MYVHLNQPLDPNIELATFPFGSQCYGTAKSWSDNDYLVLVSKNTGDLVLRYTDEDDYNDYTYVGADSFWKTLNFGAEQVYFEAIHTNQFDYFYRKSFNRLTPNILSFYNDRVARMYVGYAKRDLKQNATGRIFHINRCLWMADKVMKKELINLIDIKNILIETDIGKLKQIMTSMREELKK